MNSLKASKVKRRPRRGKKRPVAAAAAAAAAADSSSADSTAAVAAVLATLPSKSGDDSSELESICPFDAVPTPTPDPAPRRQGPGPTSLRPVIVPKAPQNSTQFLIDDHENSSLFLSFETNYKSPDWCFLSASAPHPDPDVDVRDSSDEEHYYMRDFESEYENAKEEVLLDWSRETLATEILRLEARANSLEQMLILQDPEHYIGKLQEQLVQLQDENQRLRAGAVRTSTASSSVSSDEGGAGGFSPRHHRDHGRRRTRADTASDLVMVVAPLSLRDTDPDVATPTAGPQLLQMEIA